MNRRERLEQMGDKMKKFKYVYIKNLGDDIDDVKLKDWFEQYGKVISAKVRPIHFYGFSSHCWQW